MKNKLTDIYLAGGAAGSVLLPQAIARLYPQILAPAAPNLPNSLPYCTGVCGSCGGSCLTSACAVIWLGCCAYLKKESNDHEKVMEK
ncbi:hypothetical protein [uncultured Phascolarctobacterium sp.]|uniref:hypothetical protein n=1 Tax=uncultured Phascolarctobacterium sp. TaxID=512296 RepID=UPI0025E9632D|nr:hypothetical protein [uncultured Phascolarctobacterium sp.]